MLKIESCTQSMFCSITKKIIYSKSFIVCFQIHIKFMTPKINLDDYYYIVKKHLKYPPLKIVFHDIFMNKIEMKKYNYLKHNENVKRQNEKQKFNFVFDNHKMLILNLNRYGNLKRTFSLRKAKLHA